MGERKIVTIHSYRGGTGKSNITANIAVCAHEAGKRVAVLDTDLQSPGVHILFNFDQEKVKLTSTTSCAVSVPLGRLSTTSRNAATPEVRARSGWSRQR